MYTWQIREGDHHKLAIMMVFFEETVLIGVGGGSSNMELGMKCGDLCRG